MDEEVEAPKRVTVERGEIVLRAEPLDQAERLDYALPRSHYTIREIAFLVFAIMTTISILMAMIVPRFVNRQNGTPLMAAKTDLACLETALDAFEIDTGRYPTPLEGLTALVARPASTGTTWNGPYIKAVPTDPWGHGYVYQAPGRHKSAVDLTSLGPDGKLGTADDVNNW